MAQLLAASHGEPCFPIVVMILGALLSCDCENVGSLLSHDLDDVGSMSDASISLVPVEYSLSTSTVALNVEVKGI